MAMGTSVSSMCTVDVYIRPAGSFDSGYQTSMSFAKGKELFKDIQHAEKLYAFETKDDKTIYYEIDILEGSCGDVVYENCIKSLSAMILAKDFNGNSYKIIVYK